MSLIERFHDACVYPGDLDEKEVERQLAAFLQALGLSGRIVRLRAARRRADHSPSDRQIVQNQSIADIFVECVGSEPVVRARRAFLPRRAARRMRSLDSYTRPGPSCRSGYSGYAPLHDREGNHLAAAAALAALAVLDRRAAATAAVAALVRVAADADRRGRGEPILFTVLVVIGLALLVAPIAEANQPGLAVGLFLTNVWWVGLIVLCANVFALAAAALFFGFAAIIFGVATISGVLATLSDAYPTAVGFAILFAPVAVTALAALSARPVALAWRVAHRWICLRLREDRDEIGIGGRLATPPLPHHRAYGSRTTAVRPS